MGRSRESGEDKPILLASLGPSTARYAVGPPPHLRWGRFGWSI